jgi:hypothetical protein
MKNVSFVMFVYSGGCSGNIISSATIHVDVSGVWLDHRPTSALFISFLLQMAPQKPLHLFWVPTLNSVRFMSGP